MSPPPAEEEPSRLVLGDLLAACLHLVFPTPCHTCQQPLDRRRRGALCGRCWDALERMPVGGCLRCGWPFPGPGGIHGVLRPLCQRCREREDHFTLARAVLRYREGGIARAAILLAKHGGRLSLLRHLAKLLAEEAPQHLLVGAWDGLVPVPLHWRRRLRRGFNQAEILARGVGRDHRLPVLRGALRRLRPTPPQQGDADARRANVRDAFAVPDGKVAAGKRLLLVDDVFTTGATANACAQVLLAAGAEAVGILTLARVE
ncbi:MAG TPA: ComF family protein [Candidatus Methylomirabilis sp.]|nr:ComF family protein [Candidatus Methylomirabilis sp.]